MHCMAPWRNTPEHSRTIDFSARRLGQQGLLETAVRSPRQPAARRFAGYPGFGGEPADPAVASIDAIAQRAGHARSAHGADRPVAVGERLNALLAKSALNVVRGGAHDLASAHADALAPLVDAHLMAG